jgi:GT2 family glycosyltransferase
MEKKLYHSVVVCTKDRREDIKFFLYSLIAQKRKADELLIVDASEQEKGVESDVRKIVSGRIELVKYYKTRPNLAHQKNFAVSKLDPGCGVVSFFDDDVILEPDYLGSVMDVFERDENSNIGGITGKISNAKDTGMRFIKKIFCLYSSGKGKILKSGFNVRNLDNMKEPVFIQWMPGGMSSYRKAVFNEFTFDEYYSRNGAGREDIDFSFKVSKKYKLLFISKAVLEHKESSVSRIAEKQFGYIQVVERYYFIRRNMDNFTSKLIFFWSIFGVIVINFSSVLLVHKEFKLRIQRLIGNIKGLKHCVFDRLSI